MKNALLLKQEQDTLTEGHYLITIAVFQNGDWYVNGFSKANGQGSITPNIFDGKEITNLVCRSLSRNNRDVQERLLLTDDTKNRPIKITRLDTGKSTTLEKHANTGVWQRTGVNDPIFTREYGKTIEIVIEYA